MILVLVEHDRGRTNELSLEALAFGRQLAERVSEPLHALLVGEFARPLAEVAHAFGAEVVYLALADGLEDYAPLAWARCLVDVVEREGATCALAAASERGAEVLAHAAALMDEPLAANCIAVEPADPWLVTRQRWGGSLLEQARLSGRVRLLTVAPHAVLAEEAPSPATAELREVTPELTERDVEVRVTARVERGAGKLSLSEARVVVGGGRGVGGPDGFQPLEELAGLLGGAVGCSRVATSNGWRPHADQIGQTGARIGPELYVACGISGATQHIVGCKGAKRILVINSDPEAPIMAQADYAVIGDLHQIVPAISAALRSARGG